MAHDDTNGRGADDVTDAEIDDLTLDELRAEIESIDREIVELIARRTYVASSVAQVKAERGMATVDEGQEAAVMNRAADNAERFDVDANLVKAIFRLLIELNKVEQREWR
ncbi:MAG: chorismate mutase [Haloferacaceae archaeon]